MQTDYRNLNGVTPEPMNHPHSWASSEAYQKELAERASALILDVDLGNESAEQRNIQYRMSTIKVLLGMPFE